MKEDENRLAVGEAVPNEFGGSEDNDTLVDRRSDRNLTTNTAPPLTPFRPTSAETIAKLTVRSYLTTIVDDPTIGLDAIRDSLLGRMNGAFALENLGRKAAESPSPPIHKIHALDELTVANVLLARHRIVAVDLSEGVADDMTMLAMYVDFGDDNGLFSTSESRIKALASDLKPSMTAGQLDSLFARLKIHAPVVQRTMESHLIPVANGVFDHTRQTLRSFSPDWVFLSKIQVEFDARATSPVIKMPDSEEWEVESWMKDLSDDEGIPELLWEVASAAIRSNAPWDKAFWLTAERGNNGKGTFVQMLRNLLGAKSCSAVKFADFGHEFKMEPLVTARVNLVDENGVGAFTERIEDWKAAITGDVFMINRKHKTPVAVRFRGVDIQCFNSRTPKTKDKTESFYRRLLIVPFSKWFGGNERKYIKSDYLGRPEVLRYVLKRSLEMQHTEVSNPKVCQDALDDYRGTNNLLLSFWTEFEPQLKWDLVPFRFLHDLYREWARKTNPSGQPESLNALTSFLRERLATSREWEHKGQVAVRPGRKMGGPEPLIAEYNLSDWMNGSYTGSDPSKRSTVGPLKPNYKGLLRLPPANYGGATALEDVS